MCIMEMHVESPTSSMIQACTHNLSTIERDLDMLEPLLQARGSTVLSIVVEAHANLTRAYHLLRQAWSTEVGR